MHDIFCCYECLMDCIFYNPETFSLTLTILQKQYYFVLQWMYCRPKSLLSVFSSSKETCSLRLSQLDSTTIEMLQVLKHLYQRERLNFNTGLLAVKEDYEIEGPVTESAVLELLKAGKVEELHELYLNWTIESE